MNDAAEGVIVCTLVDARRRLGDAASGDPAAAPAVARRLREAGARAVCIVGVEGVEVEGVDGAAHKALDRLDWLDSEHARGWLAAAPGAPAQAAQPDAFARHLADAMARGFVAADAAVLAKMATSAGPVPAGECAEAAPAGQRAGAAPSAAEPEGFACDPALLPWLSWGEAPRFAAPPRAPAGRRLDLYAVVDSAERVQQVLDAGIRTVQLRMKTPEAPDAAWHAALRTAVQRSVAACASAGAELFVNDHWQLASELGAGGVHLGQEDLLALGEAGRADLLSRGLALGISSHSLWELCRARTLAPRYVACGPVWPTLTKAMPWRPQGLDNLAWWCRMAGVPVVAIGGVLEADKLREAARCGADGVCIVRGLGERPAEVLPALQRALDAGRSAPAEPAPAWPHPSLAA